MQYRPRWGSFSPDVGGAEDDAGDVDQAGVVESVQHGLVQAAPDACSRPDQETALPPCFDIPKQGGNARQAQPLTGT
ncbi:hypothetical protein ACWCXM_22105 [Streptomyces sp. 900105755]